MLMKQENSTTLNRVDCLFDALTEQFLSDPNQARINLIEQGKDPDAIVAHGLALINKLKGRADLEISIQKTKQRYELAKQMVLKKLETISNPKEYLTNLLVTYGKSNLQVNFRNINGNLSNEELLDMIDEVELLHIFGELDGSSSTKDK